MGNVLKINRLQECFGRNSCPIRGVCGRRDTPWARGPTASNPNICCNLRSKSESQLCQGPWTLKDAMIQRMEERELKQLNRRQLLKLAPVAALGLFAVPKLNDYLVGAGVRVSDRVSEGLFRSQHLAPVFLDSEVVPFSKFPYNGYDVTDPGVDLENWTLTVEGDVQHPGEYKLSQIQVLPKISQNTRHICVEGWDVIGAFGGSRISDFLRLVGANPSARFLEVECADEYYESIDMASVLHPQSLLCYEMYGQPLDRGHGAPLRLQMPTKLGYKQAKYLETIRVTNVLKPGKTGYWEDQGYSWFGGL